MVVSFDLEAPTFVWQRQVRSQGWLVGDLATTGRRHPFAHGKTRVVPFDWGDGQEASVSEFFGLEFMPHGYCIRWQPLLVGVYVASDVLITLAYYAIPAMLLYFTRRRPDVRYNWIFYLFAAFIFLCGTTHIVGVVTLWIPAYGIDAMLKAATAAVSVMTAIVLFGAIPHALLLRSPTELEAVNRA